MKNPYKSFSKVNPQPSTGDRRIENSIFEHLIKAGLPGPEYQCVLFIIDKTWGYRKTEDQIALSQFEDATHLDRRYINRVLVSLEARRIIVVERTISGGRGRSNSYMFNKYWDTWITPNSHKQQQVKSDNTSLLEETPTDSHSLPSNSDEESLNERVTGGHSLAEETVTNPPGNSDSHAQGNSDQESLTKTNTKANTKTNIYNKPDQLIKEISTLYEENIGPIKPALADELREFCESFTGPVAWIKPAFREALARNKKSWHYIRTVLENWEEQGGPDDTGTGSTGEKRSDKHRRSTKAPTREQYLRSLPGRGRGDV